MNDSKTFPWSFSEDTTEYQANMDRRFLITGIDIRTNKPSTYTAKFGWLGFEDIGTMRPSWNVAGWPAYTVFVDDNITWVEITLDYLVELAADGTAISWKQSGKLVDDLTTLTKQDIKLLGFYKSPW